MTMQETLELRGRLEMNGKKEMYRRRIATLNKAKRKGLISIERFLKLQEYFLKAMAA